MPGNDPNMYINHYRAIGMCFPFLLFLMFAPGSYNPVHAAEKEDDNGVYNQDVIDEYRQSVNKLQTTHGPFDPRLSDPLLGLGHALKNQGAYSEAADIFKRAMYIKRVNNGLYDIGQISILENIIECNMALQNWDEVDDEYHYLLWIFEKAYPKPDPARLEALDEVISWHLAAFNLSTETVPARHLITVRDLNKTAVALAEQLYGESSQELVSRLYKLALAEYYIAVGIQRGGLNGMALTDMQLTMNLSPSYTTAGEEIIDKVYLKGLRILKRIISIYSEASESEQSAVGMATVYLADWNLLFNKHSSAFRLYQEAYNKLSAGGVTGKTIDDYFSQPVILPIDSFSNIPDASGLKDYNPIQFAKTISKDDVNNIRDINIKPLISWSDSLPGLIYPAHASQTIKPLSKNSFAYASFDVSKKGLAQKIHILDYQEHNGATRKRAYDMLWSMQFRPRLVRGKAVTSRNYLLRYILPE